MKDTLENISNSKFLEIKFNNWVIDVSLLPLFIFVFIPPASYAELNRNWTPETFILWIIEKTLAWTPCYFFWEWIRKLLQNRSIRKINFLQMISIGFLGGLLATFIGFVFIELFQLPNNISYLTRFVSTEFVAIGILICTSILGRKRREYALRRRGFRKTAIQSSFLQLKTNGNFRLEVKKFESNLKNELLNKLKTDDPNKTTYDLMEVVRDYSHELGNKKDLKPFQSNLQAYKSSLMQELKFVSFGFKRQALKPGVFAFTIALIFGVTLIRHNVRLVTFTMTGIYFFITYAFHYYHKILLRTRTRSTLIPVLINLGNLLTISMIDLVFSSIFPELFEHTILSIRFVFIFITYSFFCLVGHLAQSSSKLEEHLLLSVLVSENQSLYTELVMDQIKDNVSLKWSNFLHNEIQSRFLAIVLSEKKSQVKSETKLILEYIDSKSFVKEISRHSRSTEITKDLSHIRDLWKNIIIVDFKVDDAICGTDFNEALSVEILEVVNELISNSVRHGEASKIDFVIEPRSNNRYYISASNDGLPYKAGKSGLGLVLFNEVAPSNWSIRNLGNLVKAEIVLIGNN